MALALSPRLRWSSRSSRTRTCRAGRGGCRVERLRAADAILHAGDFMELEVLHALQALGPPVHAVRGNVDTLELIVRLPLQRTVEFGGVRIGMVHDAGPSDGRLERMRRRFPDTQAVVFGHSHIPLHEEPRRLSDLQSRLADRAPAAAAAHDGHRARSTTATLTFELITLTDAHRKLSFETCLSIGPRKLDDPKAMRAMAHPIRLALLEALADAGTLTATEAGERVGESPANASFHLRQLAKYGFVEEAEGGTGRKRPWKLGHLGMRFTDVQEDPETATAARALDRVLRDRYLARAGARSRSARRCPKSGGR